VRHVCPTCQEHGTPCYFALKQRSGLFERPDAATNGHRNALDPRQWLVVGVDLDWPPPPEPGVWKPEAFFALGEPWSDQREDAALARELEYIRSIGNMTEVLDL
jgi:hypothetical protein